MQRDVVANFFLSTNLAELSWSDAALGWNFEVTNAQVAVAIYALYTLLNLVRHGHTEETWEEGDICLTLRLIANKAIIPANRSTILHNPHKRPSVTSGPVGPRVRR